MQCECERRIDASLPIKLRAMRAAATILLYIVLEVGAVSCEEPGIYNFFQYINSYRGRAGVAGAGAGGRRALGPRPAAGALADFPFVCLVLDARWAGRCSGAAVAPRWVLTAAHCVAGAAAARRSRLTYVTYNSDAPYERGDSVDVVRTYRHPDYKVKRVTTAKGVSVGMLVHDVGLVLVTHDMQLAPPTAPPPLLSSTPTAPRAGTEPPLRPLYDTSPLDLTRQIKPEALDHLEVQVYGFMWSPVGGVERARWSERGRGGRGGGGEGGGVSLFAAKIALQRCGPARAAAWYPCVCGVRRPAGARADICWADSGGPVVHNGIQVGVVSMGPVDCVLRPEPRENASSVITPLYPYLGLIEATVRQAKGLIVMTPLSDRAVAVAAPSDHVRPLFVGILFVMFL